MSLKEWYIVGALFLRDPEWLGSLARAKFRGNVTSQEIKNAVQKLNKELDAR